ncbi:calcium-responsive transcription factor isoform X2 [Mixophyes fleayi]|uniref:calcium-responsive transcription factor isoform X2 n=1 Tax=Mixophyes fleayi TaxID=3061075 RepID=UPI003F4E15DD
MEMENNGLECDTVTHPTELLITCTNTDTHSGDSELELEDATQQQISTLTEQYHFIDQNGHAIHYEIQALSGTSPQMMILTSESENGQVFHVIPSTPSGTAQLIIPQGIEPLEHNQISDGLQTVSDGALPENTSSLIIHSNTSLSVSKKSPPRLSVEQFQKPLQPLPPNIPVWARRLRSCEKIGDSYRGYCLSEAELMNILGLHKQQTMSVWGTRQSPSPAKPATRLMWKSQYVPYDGIPFVNAGSRAIVMECQYGPRRKGAQPKKSVESDNTSGQLYKATCPARIYIKKVKKFPSYRVPTDPKIDKKLIKMEQEKAFNLLKKDLDGKEGILRKFVERELFKLDEIPERHNLSYFPTVNDLKNHIHEAQKALGNGELIYDQETIPGAIRELQWTSDNGNVLNELVTVTFESSSHEEQDLLKLENPPSEDVCQDTAQLITSLTSLQPKIFAQLQGLQLQPSFASPDGTTALITVNQASPTFTSPDETTALITVNPQTPSFTTSDGTAALITVNHQPPFTPSNGTTSLITVNPPALLNAGGSSQPLVLSHLQSQHNDSSMSTVTTLPASSHNLVSMGQLVTVEDSSGISRELHQILLGEIHPIPIRILDNQPTIVEVSPVDTFCTEQVEESHREPLTQSRIEGAGITDC